MSVKEGQQFDLFAAPGSGSSSESDSSQRKNLTAQEHWYQLVDTEKARELLLQKLLQQTQVCFDTETTSLNALEADLVGIAFSWTAGQGYYLALPEDRNK